MIFITESAYDETINNHSDKPIRIYLVLNRNCQ